MIGLGFIIFFLYVSYAFIFPSSSPRLMKGLSFSMVNNDKINPDDQSPVSGYTLLKFPGLNKGTSFTDEEITKLKIRGLVPAGGPISLDTKVEFTMQQLRKKNSPIEKYIFLHTIQDADETLYYACLIRHTVEVMPFVYTPTVGQACQEWSTITRHLPRGVYIGLNDAGRVREILDNYPNKNIKVICMTDGERILGLGDQGSNGMGIPVGKLSLYVACAGINPSQVLPVLIDVGCNRPEYLKDPAYVGLRRERERGPAYDELIAEFFSAAQEAYGKDVLIQFEDFGNSNAFRLLETYRTKSCSFNDDIQGTASVVLAGFISALGLSGRSKLGDHTYLFFGAGEAGVGIADLLSSAIARESGIPLAEARKRVWLVDSKGLVTSTRSDAASQAHHKVPYAHAVTTEASDLITAVKTVRPTALVGVSAQPAAFTQEVVEEMASYNESPIIFALSNPTSKAECTAEQAYTWTKGKAIFASGSPFGDVTLPDGSVKIPGQGNNAYIFPAVGLAAVVTGAKEITDYDFEIAAVTLSKMVSPERLAQGCLYPSLKDIREVSATVAAAVAEAIYSDGRASKLPKPGDLLNHCKSVMYVPSYSDI